MSRLDPLLLARQAIASGKVVYEDGVYTFGPYKYTDSTKTSFRRTLKTGEQYHYTLRDVIFFSENATVSLADYRRKVVEARVTAVVEQDKQNLLQYLAGAIDTCSQIDVNFVYDTPINADDAAAKVSKIAQTSSIASSSQIDSSSTSIMQHGDTHVYDEMSSEHMKEQLLKHAAFLDKSIRQKTTATDADGSTKKRKIETVSAHANKSDALDATFIQADKQILSNLRSDETPAFTRATILCKAGIDFKSHIKDRSKKPVSQGASTSALPRGVNSVVNSHVKNSTINRSNSNSTLSQGQQVQKQQVRSYIIIVPNAMTSPITLMNAEDFLKNGKYIPTEETGNSSNSNSATGKKESEIRFEYQGTRYMVIDNPKKLSPQDWDRVVAVFTTGQSWQFKDWKWSQPVELFKNVLGIHLTIDGRTVNPNVLSWNCKVIKISQFKRHLDAGASNEFWSFCNDFIKLHK